MTTTHEVAPTQRPDHAGVAFHPPVLLLLALLGGSGARWITQLPFLPDGMAVLLGPMIVMASFTWFGWAVRTMRSGGASIPTSEPTDAIVTRGPYGMSRNPIYLSMVILQVGVGIWANSGWFLAPWLCHQFVLPNAVERPLRSRIRPAKARLDLGFVGQAEPPSKPCRASSSVSYVSKTINSLVIASRSFARLPTLSNLRLPFSRVTLVKLETS